MFKRTFGMVVVVSLVLYSLGVLLGINNAAPVAYADAGDCAGAVTDIFVDDTNGNDDNGNGSSGAPYATIQTAAAAAISGDTICVEPGYLLCG